MSLYSELADLAKTNGINLWGGTGKKSTVQLVQEMLTNDIVIPDELLPEAFKEKPKEEFIPPIGATEEEISRKRAKADELVEKAKKKKKWNPIGKPDVLKVAGKDDRFHYRFINRNPERIHDAREQGFEFVDSNTGIPGAEVSHETIQDGKPIDGVRSVKRDLVLMAVPKEPYLDLRETESKKRRQQALESISPKRQAEKAQTQFGPKANMHGQIIIE